MGEGGIHGGGGRAMGWSGSPRRVTGVRQWGVEASASASVTAIATAIARRSADDACACA